MKNKLIHNKTLNDFADLVIHLGGDLPSLLNEVNLTPNELSSSQVGVSYKDFIRLVEAAAVKLNYPAFGLHLSTSLDIHIMGCLDVLAKKNLTFSQAMQSAQQFLSLYSNRSDCWEMIKDKHLIIISRFENSDTLELSVQEKELSYGVYLRVLQKILGYSLKNCRIEFTHNNITGMRLFKKFLKIDVAFNQECERIIVDGHYLKQPLSHINDIKCDQSFQAVLYQVSHISIEQQVKNLIMQNMINKTHTIENIASKLDMHPRSLQRRLEEKNVKFKQLLNDLRIDVACWHLRASNKSVTLISEILGYNEVSSFSRSFKKYKKCSALQWRKTHTVNG